MRSACAISIWRRPGLEVIRCPRLADQAKERLIRATYPAIHRQRHLVPVHHVFVCRMAATDWRDAVAPCRAATIDGNSMDPRLGAPFTRTLRRPSLLRRLAHTQPGFSMSRTRIAIMDPVESWFAKRLRSLVAYPNSSRSSSAAIASLRSFAYASSIGMSAALPGANPQSG